MASIRTPNALTVL